jgi:hypothetical protein
MFDFECIGNVHIHTAHSDGKGTVPQIAECAAKIGLDFIILNDHSYMTDALYLNEEGFYGKVLVLVGSELGVRFHHYLAFDLKQRIAEHNLPPQKLIDDVQAQGGFGFLAHPFEKGMPFAEKSVAYTWNDLSVTGYQGICLWNFMSRWKERVRTVLHGFFFLTFKTQLLKGPSRETLDFWDQQCRLQRMAIIGGSDAHATEFKWGPLNLTPFTYDYLLNSITVHLFLKNRLPKLLEEAKKEVYGALKEGRLFIAHDNLCPSKGFRFDFISNDGSDLYMGEEGEFREGSFVIEIPADGEVRLVKDGQVLQKWRGREVMYEPKEKGVYRVEAYRRQFPFGWRPWIFSNPIYLR